MKIDLKLPGSGELHFEKEPMGEDVLFSIGAGAVFFGVIGVILFVLWMFR